MQYAVIHTGGKQYIVEEGQTIVVEKLDCKEGGSMSFKEVLLTSNGGEVLLGKPLVKGASVKAKVIEHGKGPKKLGMKYERSGYRKKFGHRQPYSRVEIVDIQTSD